eukprot:GHVH01011041.1.p1 GENE.GHVH01011041.1~~GHVH01011041.1.p1  ORF type:complete len:455 (-),score=51.81 GHVH01011041.1:42-1376(-)
MYSDEVHLSDSIQTTPTTKDRSSAKGFPDRSPETKNADEKLSYLCEDGASVLCYAMTHGAEDQCSPGLIYNCGSCSVCSVIEKCMSGHPPNGSHSYFRASKVKGGITNLMLLLKHPTLPPRALRIFGLGSEHIIDRQREKLIVEYLSQQGIGKHVYSRFLSTTTQSEGQIEEWIDGESLTPEQMRDETVSHAIARRIARLHTIPVPTHLEVPQNSSPNEVVTRISNLHVVKTLKWLKSAEDIIANDSRFTAMKLMNLSMVTDYLHRLLLLDKNLKTRKDVLFDDEQRLVHGDLLSGNILLQSCGSVRFIDFEYTDVGAVNFDLANHFNECTGFSCSEADYDKYYPDESTQRAFIGQYIKEVLRLQDKTLSDEEIKDEENRIYDEVQVNVLVSHLYWGAWALNKALWQSTEKQIEFDFHTYAFQRLSAGLSWAFQSRIPSLVKFA